MELLTIIAIAVGLAMDAFAVSIATGIKLGCLVRIHHTIRLAFFFGFFQFFMTVLGWFSGYSVENYIGAFDHWVAIILLGTIGSKMIYDSLKGDSSSDMSPDPTKGWMLLSLSIATSIDAFAVGISLGVLNAGIWFPSIIIGLIAAAFTTAGMSFGCQIGLLVSRKIEIAGGIILILIGLKIFIEHIIKGI
ncbi:manganese efflux pump MntP family protein [Candidatus Latescibacterota bacterium]